MSGKNQQPAPQDPYQVAGAQTQSNQNTAAYNSALNKMNTYSPTGAQTYSFQGYDPNTGAPIYSEQLTLSPEQQQLYNQNTQNQNQQSAFAGSLLNNLQQKGPPQMNSSTQDVQNAQNALYSRNTQYLDPQFAMQKEQLQSQLANEGATPGSEAYNNAMTQFGNQQNQAYEAARNDSISGATQQAQAQQGMDIAAQNQPLNYYNALMSGSQASMPQANATPSSSANGTNLEGAFNNAYQQQLNAYNSSVNSNNQTLSTVGSLIAAFLSDPRTKDDHGTIGETHDGIPIHAFNYKGDNKLQIGVMSDEVKKKKPEAVQKHPSGYDMVDYKALL